MKHLENPDLILDLDFKFDMRSMKSY